MREHVEGARNDADELEYGRGGGGNELVDHRREEGDPRKSGCNSPSSSMSMSTAAGGECEPMNLK